MLRPRTQGALRQSLFTSVFSPVFSSVFGGAGAAPAPVDAYAIGGASPELVAAFLTAADGTTEGEYFRTAGSADDFSMFTFSRAEKATMSDSTGTLVWAPHNLTLYSEDFTNAAWQKVLSGIAESPSDPFPGFSALYRWTTTSASNPYLLQSSITVEAGADYTFAMLVKYVDVQWVRLQNQEGETVWFDLLNGVKGTETNATGAISALTDGFYLIEVEFDANDNSTYLLFTTASADGSGLEAIGSVDVQLATAYRSDLGGMADNPDQPAGLEKYVPTTSAAVYLSRRNAYYYNGTAWTKGGLRWESAAATNLIATSNDFSTVANGTGTQNATGPDGTTSAWTILDNGAGGAGQTQENETVTVATETTYTTSIFAKADQSNWLCLSAISFTTPPNSNAFFDLANGVTGTVDAGIDDARMEYYGNGWWRCSVTFTTDVADTSGFLRYFVCAQDNNINITLDGTNSLLMYGKQFETGPIATSYIPTSGSTIARPAETLSIAGADTPANTTAMSISMKGLMTYADTGTLRNVSYYRWYINGDNFIWAYQNTINAPERMTASQETASVSDFAFVESYTAGTNVSFNIASRHTSSAINVAADGTSATADETPTALVDLSGTAFTPGYDFNGFISELRMWGTDIGDSGIEEVTTP